MGIKCKRLILSKFISVEKHKRIGSAFEKGRIKRTFISIYNKKIYYEKVTIKENERGLVFKKDVLTQVLPQGSYWFFGGERISIFNVFEEFPEIEQRIFEHTLLKDHLEIV